LLVVDARDRRAAHVAGLAELVVYAVDALVAGSALAQLEPARELGVDRVGELLDLSRDQVPGQGKRRQLRVMEDLIRPGAADAGGSKVFGVAMCAGPAFSTGNARTGSSKARRHASISGSSGTYASRLMDPISVAVSRGSFVESQHLVHAVAVQKGAVVAEAGD